MRYSTIGLAFYIFAVFAAISALAAAIMSLWFTPWLGLGALVSAGISILFFALGAINGE